MRKIKSFRSGEPHRPPLHPDTAHPSAQNRLINHYLLLRRTRKPIKSSTLKAKLLIIAKFCPKIRQSANHLLRKAKAAERLLATQRFHRVATAALTAENSPSAAQSPTDSAAATANISTRSYPEAKSATSDAGPPGQRERDHREITTSHKKSFDNSLTIPVTGSTKHLPDADLPGPLLRRIRRQSKQSQTGNKYGQQRERKRYPTHPLLAEVNIVELIIHKTITKGCEGAIFRHSVSICPAAGEYLRFNPQGKPFVIPLQNNATGVTTSRSELKLKFFTTRQVIFSRFLSLDIVQHNIVSTPPALPCINRTAASFTITALESVRKSFEKFRPPPSSSQTGIYCSSIGQTCMLTDFLISGRRKKNGIVIPVIRGR